ncbi:MAG: pyroglutamyl-peptidase I [Hyphomicrobium sp.]|uniref:pyroglutamyl-peptidase I family protein n=1 Tax=Hyphomicrobium sp. TaxID=82 RepID=UPI0039E68F55
MVDKADIRPTVLLTGFGPFPGVPVNASGELVRRLVRIARREFPNVRFVAAVLPTEWGRAPRRIAALHARYHPVLALHFGVASGLQCVRLETTGRNALRASPDAAGVLPADELLCPDGLAERRATIDIPRISRALEARGWPCSSSDDAGGYLCNAALYQSLACAEHHGGSVGFVHIPADLSQSPLAMKRGVETALEIVRAALGPKTETAEAPALTGP